MWLEDKAAHPGVRDGSNSLSETEAILCQTSLRGARMGSEKIVI